MKTRISRRIHLTIYLTLTALLITVAATPAVAQSPTPDAIPLVGDWRTLPEGQEDWYRFDYVGDELMVRVWLDMVPEDGAEFDIWTADMLQRRDNGEADLEPLGSGTTNENEPGALYWQGASPDEETYYIVVRRRGAGNAQYLLNISGPGLASAPRDLDEGGPEAAPANTGMVPAQEGVPAGPGIEVVGESITPTVATTATAPVTTAPVTATATVTTTVPTTPLVESTIQTGQAENIRTLGDGEVHWYLFLQRGDNTPVEITMDADPVAGAGFAIYAPVDARALFAGGSLADVAPLGQGAQNAGSSAFLSWRGAFDNPGIYYVMVTDNIPGNMSYSINFSGEGLAHPVIAQPITVDAPAGAIQAAEAVTAAAGAVAAQPAATPAPAVPATAPTAAPVAPAAPAAPAEADETDETAAIPAAQPSPTATGVAAVPASENLQNPPAAEALGGNWRTLRVGESHWYTFDHSGNGDTVQVWMDVEPNEGAGFHIFSAGDAEAIRGGRDPQEFSPVGSGTPNENEPGSLFWRGNFAEPGTFYILVTHGWDSDVNYAIYVAGPGLAR